jgi:hypothetical protein
MGRVLWEKGRRVLKQPAAANEMSRGVGRSGEGRREVIRGHKDDFGTVLKGPVFLPD